MLGGRLLATRRHVHTEQRRACYVDVAGFDEFGKVPEKQREQQHLDVRAIHVGIAQDAHLAVAQARQIRRIVGAVRVHANRHRDVVDFVVGKQPVALDLPGVEHLAAQRQDGLAFLVAAHLGAAAGRVALNQKHFVVREVAAFAVGQLAGQHGHARAFALFDLLAGLLPRLRGLDGQFGEFLAIFDMLVQPQLERRAHKARHQPHRVARVQPLLDLALELRVQHLGREHVAGARKHVFGQQLDALGQQAVQFDEAFDGGKQAVAQAALVRAARTGGDQVDIALAHRLAVFGEGHAPGRALAFGKTLVPAIGKTFALEQRDHRFAVQGLLQIVAQAALVLPGLGVTGFFVDQRNAHARHQHRLAAQQVRELVHGQVAGLEIFGVGPGTHRGALLAIAFALGLRGQRLDHITGREHEARDLAFAVARRFEPGGERVGHAHTHTMQAAREAVGAALAFVELAARMQAREDQLDHRRVFFRVQAKRDASAIVFDAHRAIGVQGDLDLFAVAGQRFVGGVVQHFLDDVQGVVGAGVHARPLLNGLQALEHADRAFGVFAIGGNGRGFGCHGGGL